MPITINGSGTVTGLSAGGLPDGSITSADLASGAITAGALPTGSILQVVAASTHGSAYTSSSTFEDSGLCTASITTSVANSKLLVIQTFSPEVYIGENTGQHIAMRSSVDSYAANLVQGVANYHTNYGVELTPVLQYLHNPSQTSGTTITYRLYFKRYANTNNQYINDGWGITPTHAITIMEVAP